MRSSDARGWSWGGLAQVAVAIGLLLLVGSQSLVAYLAEVDAGLALKIDSKHPVASLRLAEQIVADIEAAEPQKKAASRAESEAQRRLRFGAPAELASTPRGGGDQGETDKRAAGVPPIAVEATSSSQEAQGSTASAEGAASSVGESAASSPQERSSLPVFGEDPPSQTEEKASPSSGERALPIFGEDPSTTAAEPAPGPSAERVAALAEARQLVETALRGEPLNYRALALLGKIVQMAASPESGVAAARPYFELAARLSPRASDALYWLLLRHLEDGDFAAATTKADTLLRTTSRATAAVFPILIRLAEMPEASSHVIALLKTDPPWRKTLFAVASKYVTDARTLLTLLLALRDTEHPASDEDLNRYLNFLVSRQLHDLAYYTWLQFLPSDRLASAGLLFNGSFDSKPSGSPFDWTISQGVGASVEFAPLPDDAGGQGLRLEFMHGRVEFRGVSQVVVLSPGRYVLQGRHRGELEGRRGLRWRVVCMDERARHVLAETPMHLGPISLLQPFDLDFEVPEVNCPFQQIRLDLDARSSSERLVKGTFWYSDLAITRVSRKATVGAEVQAQPAGRAGRP